MKIKPYISNFVDAGKAVPKGRCITLNDYIRK